MPNPIPTVPTYRTPARSILTPSRRTLLLNGGLAAAALALSPRTLLAADAPPAIVNTPLGILRGETLPDSTRVFRGVPFAQPPIGPLRFRPPLPPRPWSSVQSGVQSKVQSGVQSKVQSGAQSDSRSGTSSATRDATTFAPAAIQPDEPADQSEDCLYLNIWAPAAGGPYPVFVWIHGGGFTGGRASAPIFDGAEFAHEGIVLVTVAYRLGVLGFMDLEPLLGSAFADSGNNAMRDLVASLQWVQQNISAFGGDPSRVTVGGESAGAKATAALMAIPEARSLFHSAVSQSGGGERVLTRTEAAEVAQSFGDLWRRNHPSTSGSPFADLLTAPPRALIETQQQLIAQSARHFPFRSEVGPGGLLTGRPVDLLTAGAMHGKRLLIGTDRDESALFLGPHPAADPTARDLGNLSLARFNQVFARYKSLYPQMSDEGRRIRAVTAEEYWVPSVRLADAHTRSGGAAWMYRLDFAGSTGRMANEAYHSSDLGFVWNKLGNAEQSDANARQLAQSMHTAWCAFIRGDAPAAPPLPPWPEYNARTRPTMILNTDSHVEQQPFEAELRLWDGVL